MLSIEADHVAGPWRLVCYLRDFRAQGYFVNIPSKFIQSDGKAMWPRYSANFTNDWLHTNYPIDPATQSVRDVPAGDQVGSVTEVGKVGI